MGTRWALPWLSFTAGGVVLGGVHALCVVCAVSMAPWWSFIVGVVLFVVGVLGVLCVRCQWLLGSRSPLLLCF